MIYLDNLEAFADLCRMRNMHGLYVSSGSWFDEIADRTDGIPPSCPLICLYLPTAQAFADGCAVFLFDTDEECRAAFDRVLGDDHRAPIQYRTYAITCSNLGDLMDENT